VKLLEPAKEAFHKIAILIHMTVILSLLHAVGFWWNHRFNFALNKLFEYMICIIGLVRPHSIGLEFFNQRLCMRNVANLPTTEQIAQWIAQRIDCSMDFGTQPAPGASKRLIACFFLGACCMLVGSDDSAVDHECFQISIHAEHAHDGQPTTTFTPLVKARVRGVPVPQLSRQVASGCTGSRNPQNGFNNSAIVCSGNPAVACLAGQHLHLGPYYVTEKLSCHCYSNHSKMIINTLLRKNRAFQDDFSVYHRN
jgi:hypothetical protein